MSNLIKINPKLLRGKKPEITPLDKCWIAGGAVRQYFCGNEKPSDIDYFFANEEAEKKMIDLLVSRGASITSKQNHLTSLIYNGQLIQAIKYKYFANQQELINSFDFTVCQFVYNSFEEVCATMEAIVTVGRNHLMVNNIAKETAVDSLRRAFKYADKGYKPCLGTIKDIAEALSGLSKEEVNSQATISPGGGIRFVGVD